MTAEQYLAKQEPSRKEIMTAIHKVIVTNNKRVKPEVGTMMRQEMIQYKLDGVFMYGLCSVKAYMSLHALPMYGLKDVHAKYSKLLSKAKFQKGCINFADAKEMPLAIVTDFIKDCAKAEDKIVEMYKLRKKTV